MEPRRCHIRRFLDYNLASTRGSIRLNLESVGAIAQLGERLHGMQEVGGSIPPGSTNIPQPFTRPHRLEA